MASNVRVAPGSVLTAKEVVELRLKCLEPLIATASKAGLLTDEVLKIAERQWSFATQDLPNTDNPAPQKARDPKAAKSDASQDTR